MKQKTNVIVPMERRRSVRKQSQTECYAIRESDAIQAINYHNSNPKLLLN